MRVGLFNYFYIFLFISTSIFASKLKHDLTPEIDLNENEKEYLKNKGSINVCIDPNWMPFEKFDANGDYIGMSADYFKIFKKKIDTNFNIIRTKSWSESVEYAKQRKCDIFSLAMQTPKRKKYMNFTTPYLKIPLVITTKLNVQFVNEIKDLAGKKIGISKNYAFVELLKNKYNYLNIVEVENIDDGLDKVNNGEIFAYIGTLASVGYKFQTKYSGELKIAGKISDNWELGIGVRNDDAVLLNILQKAINGISLNQRREILNKWISIKYEKVIDNKGLYKAITIFSIIILIMIFFFYRLKELKDKLENANKKLHQLAITDKLTNLYNRHKLDEAIELEKNRADRYDTTFGVIIIDIDFFKKINDTYGHYTGDNVLKEFSSILSNNSRNTDIVGRWGGEEFLIIVPQVDRDTVVKFAQNLKDKIEKNKFKGINKLTASIGATIYKDFESVESIILRTDEALYISKNNGRNQINFL